uniref:Secreted protein n=1 Tax=Heligmosomoides polygyrus TaxID=6339 RepID=A0A183GRN8_HELPZ
LVSLFLHLFRCGFTIRSLRRRWTIGRKRRGFHRRMCYSKARGLERMCAVSGEKQTRPVRSSGNCRGILVGEAFCACLQTHFSRYFRQFDLLCRAAVSLKAPQTSAASGDGERRNS